MSFKTLMIIKAVVCLGFGPLLLFFPDPLLTLLGSAYCAGAALTAREYGAALIGTMLLTWFGRNIQEFIARRAINLALFVYDGVALVAMLSVQIAGILNPLGWGVVVVYLFFTVGFGYLFLTEKAAP